MAKQELHRHHKIPKHMGGSDDDENIIVVDRLTHAQLHYDLYLRFNKKEDLCAYYMLSGNMEEFRKIFASMGGRAIQNIRKESGLDCFGCNPERHKKNAILGGLVQGHRNRESGHMQKVQKLSDCSAAGKKGVETCKRLKKNSFFDPKIRAYVTSLGGQVQGKNNATSGHLRNIAHLSRKAKGQKWITNGSISTMLGPNESMPNGFYYGRVQNKRIKI